MKYKNISQIIGIGERIQAKREEKNMSQIELADKTGVGYRTIQKYEADDVNPGMKNLESIADVLECEVSEFILDKKEKDIIEEYRELFLKDYNHKDKDDILNYLSIAERLKETTNSIPKTQYRVEFNQAIDLLIKKIQVITERIEEVSQEFNKVDSFVLAYVSARINLDSSMNEIMDILLKSFTTLEKYKKIKKALTEDLRVLDLTKKHED